MHISPTPMNVHEDIWRQKPRYYNCQHCELDHGPTYYCDEQYQAEMAAHELTQQEQYEMELSA